MDIPTDGDLVPILMTKFLPGPVLGLVFLGAIAAIHSTAAPYIGTGGTILLRDIYWRYIRKQKAGHAEQIWVNRLLATVVTVAAVVVSLTARDAIVLIGGFATAFGFVMYLIRIHGNRRFLGNRHRRVVYLVYGLLRLGPVGMRTLPG